MAKDKSGRMGLRAQKRPCGGAGTGAEGGRDWGETLFLPQTDFPMRAGLAQAGAEAAGALGEDRALRASCARPRKGRHKFVLHDGPPYANGNIHIGHALNKILKDLVVKSQQMLGHDSNYVPGWDCHGLPIEWKIEEQYRAKGRNKDEVPVNEFRAECREFAAKWLDVQREEFKRLGVVGDWDNPYSTMAYPAEATIAHEIMKFADERAALSRLEAGDVVGRREDGAGGSGGRVPGLPERSGLGEVSVSSRRTKDLVPVRRLIVRAAS